MNVAHAVGSVPDWDSSASHRASDAARWAAVLAAALAVRVVGIGDPPLSPSEGERALEAWQLWREGQVNYGAGPLATNALSLLFGLFTAGDGQARLVSAVTGTCIVLLPLLLRPRIGARAALCQSMVLAASPLLVSASRQSSASILVFGCTLAAAICGLRFAEDGGRAWLAAMLSAVGLGLGADPAFAVALAGMVLATTIAEGEALLRPGLWRQFRQHGPGAGAIALLVVLLADTRFLMNPAGVEAGMIAPFWRWSADVARGSGWVAPMLLLLIEAGTLGLAAVGFANFRRHPRLARLLGTWLLVSFALIALLRQPDPRYLLQPLVPGVLLAGLGLERLIGRALRHTSPATVACACCLMVPLVAAGFRVNAGVHSNRDPWAGAALFAIAGVALVLIVALRALGPQRVAASLALFALVLTSLSTISTISRLLEARGSDRAQLLEPAVATEELRAVRGEVLAWQRADPTALIPADPTLRDMLAWSLHDVPRWSSTIGRRPVARRNDCWPIPHSRSHPAPTSRGSWSRTAPIGPHWTFIPRASGRGCSGAEAWSRRGPMLYSSFGPAARDIGFSARRRAHPT